jgi:hypothetical protein
MHRSHPPPVVAMPLADPLPKPWVLYASNKTGCFAHIEALSLSLLPLAHPPSVSVDVMEIHPAVVDQPLRNKVFLLNT